MAIHITSQTKSAVMRPASKDELRYIIEQELDCQGPDVDLNFIDTSLITDMSYLFEGLFIANIKIDEWDTSNVEDMSGMFEDCYNFTGTGLGKWDVSNVYNMSHMFEGATVFNRNLPNWDISNVKRMDGIFDNTKLDVYTVFYKQIPTMPY